MNEGNDHLDHLIGDAIATQPGFADLWAPYALMLDLSAERVRLGLSQQEVAERMGHRTPGDGAPKPGGSVGRPVAARTKRRAA